MNLNLLDCVLSLQRSTSLHLPSTCLLKFLKPTSILKRIREIVIIFVHLGDELLLSLAPLLFFSFELVDVIEVALHFLLEILSLLLVIFNERGIISCMPVHHDTRLQFSLVSRPDVTFKVLFSVERCCKTSFVEAQVVAQSVSLFVFDRQKRRTAF